MKTKLAILAILCPLLSLEQPALQVGDTIPIALYQRICPGEPRPLLLDFFSIYCKVCIAELPHMQLLHDNFSERLQMVLVSHESVETSAKFIRSKPALSKVRLPIVFDSTLLQLFPHIVVPHMIWIDEHRVVRSITHSRYVDSFPVAAFINHQLPSLPQKNDNMHFSPTKPLLADLTASNSAELLSQSTITTEIPGVNGITGFKQDNFFAWYYILNYPLLSLYNDAMEYGINNRLVLEADIPHGDFSYQLRMPAGTPIAVMRARMLTDLNQQFNLYGRVEQRTVSCWQLVVTDSTLLPHSKTAKAAIHRNDRDSTYTLTRMPIKNLIYLLNNTYVPDATVPIIVDATAFDGLLDIQLPASTIHDPHLLNKLLKQFGLRLEAVQRELPLFILSHKNSTSQKIGL